jgi:ADP-ribose pyrophosphatase YjhB (NUDIX family)
MPVYTSEFALVSPVAGGARPTWGDAVVDRVRCVLRHRDRFLLADHGSRRRGKRPKWGLPGGRMQPGEEPLAGLTGELVEELRLHVPTAVELGDWWQRNENYRVFGSEVARAVRWFDERELSAVAWLTYPQVAELAAAGRLHKGFELEAIVEFRRRFPA